MPSKEFVISDIGQVKIVKSKRSRNYRLTLKADNSVRLGIPYWSSYADGLKFVMSKKQWLEQHKSEAILLQNGDKVGKAHRLSLVSSGITRTSSTVRNNLVKVAFPSNFDSKNEYVQKAAQKACLRALQIEGDELLPKRLNQLAIKFHISYTNVQVKPMKSRWGSCTSQKEITLNTYLMQLDWRQIDYVIMHELTHTKIMAHNKFFWSQMKEYLPDVEQRRKDLSSCKPYIIPQK